MKWSSAVFFPKKNVYRHTYIIKLEIRYIIQGLRNTHDTFNSYVYLSVRIFIFFKVSFLVFLTKLALDQRVPA